MKYIDIIAASLGFALTCSYSNPILAAESIPQEIIDFAEQNGLVLGKAASPIINKYPLTGKSVNLVGRLSISGKATYLGHDFPFSAPGINNGIWRARYIFGQPQANGSIPFKLNYNAGNFVGIMKPIKPDTYILKMNDPQGSVLSSLAYYGKQLKAGWENTKYSYTATVTKKLVNGVATKFFAVKELASFKINIPNLPGATANYTYSYDWKAKMK